MSDVLEHKPAGPIARVFNATVLRYPLFFLVLTAAFTLFFMYHIRNFKLDASADSIVLENDKDLRYYNESRDLFGSDDYIIVTVTPDGDLFAPETLDRLAEMSAEFEAMEDVASVTSILNVPLFHSPDVTIFEMIGGKSKSLAEGADPELARLELPSSPLYKNYLISEDGATTALQVTFKDPPEEFQKLYRRRTALRDKAREEGLSAAEKRELKEIEKPYAELYADTVAQNAVNIAKAREIVSDYQDIGRLYLGGVPMIMADIIAYVEKDIFTFCYAVTLLVLCILTFIFRKIKWVVLPTATCVLTVLYMMGYMGFTDWSGTIVTSNFPSLLFVIALANVLHFAVHYRELYARFPDWTNKQLILQTSRDMAVPCLYTSMTTMVGFGSLIVSGIRPVMDFGIIMASGVAIAYTLCFVFLPAGLMFFPKGKVPPAELAELKKSPLMVFGRFSERHRRFIYAFSIALFVFCAYGASLLKVENRFIDYFRESTEIYQGMTVIDRELGGTTPLEIVLEGDREDFWLDADNLARLKEIHEWFDSLPETGKVLSPYTILLVADGMMAEGSSLPGPFVLRGALQGLSEEVKDAVIWPYLSRDKSQVRLFTRAQETNKDLNRKEFIATIEEHLENAAVFDNHTPHLTGVFVLYNNMLQSLVQSQIMTIGMVFGAIWLMFLLLFRSIRLATIAIIPNILPVVLVLGTLGWTGIPLDLMTIMTAAITLGIAVDVAIHYIHRFKREFAQDRDYSAAMYRCHNSIGRAMYYTTISIILGFSILFFSNFIPSIYFGLFTGLAIAVAFLAAVTLLPLLLIAWKPLGPGVESSQADEEAAPG